MTIVPYLKLNGKLRWHVLRDGVVIGQFFTKANAREFINQIKRGVYS